MSDKEVQPKRVIVIGSSFLTHTLNVEYTLEEGQTLEGVLIHLARVSKEYGLIGGLENIQQEEEEEDIQASVAPFCPVHTGFRMEVSRDGVNWYCKQKHNGGWCTQLIPINGEPKNSPPFPITIRVKKRD